MKRLSRLLELPVVDFRTGKQIARVERCCLSADGQNLCGLVVRQNGFGRRRRYVEFSTLAVIGDVSLQVKALAPLPDPLKRAEDESRRVYNTSGRLLGWMTDALLDESDGRIRALELSEGYLDELYRGRVWLRDFARRPLGFIAAYPVSQTFEGRCADAERGE